MSTGTAISLRILNRHELKAPIKPQNLSHVCYYLCGCRYFILLADHEWMRVLLISQASCRVYFLFTPPEWPARFCLIPSQCGIPDVVFDCPLVLKCCNQLFTIIANVLLFGCRRVKTAGQNRISGIWKPWGWYFLLSSPDIEVIDNFRR